MAMTRIEFGRQLAESRGLVSAGASDAEVINALASKGITTVASNYQGSREITRAEAATMLVRAGGGQATTVQEGLQKAADTGIFQSVGDASAGFESRWFQKTERQAQSVAGIDWNQVRTYDDWERTVQERFPGFAWALDHPELGPILAQAAKENWTDLTLEAALRGTDWFKSRTEAERIWDAREADPANAAQIEREITERANQIRREAGALGAELSEDQIRDIARSALRQGLQPQEVTARILANTTSYGPGAMQAGQDSIQEIAADYLVSIDEATRSSLAGKLAKGEMTADGILSYIQNIAKAQYPHMAEFIDQGISIKEYTAPHRNLVADMLGRTANDIDLTGRFRDILSLGDGGSVRPMSLSETERYVRSMDDFWRGRQGQEELYGMTNGLTRALGVRR